MKIYMVCRCELEWIDSRKEIGEISFRTQNLRVILKKNSPLRKRKFTLDVILKTHVFKTEILVIEH